MFRNISTEWCICICKINHTVVGVIKVNFHIKNVQLSAQIGLYGIKNGQKLYCLC